MTKKSKDVRLKQLLRLGICVALIALIAMVGVVMASAEEPVYSEGLEFTSNGDGTCYVSGIGTCTDTELVIPPVSPAGDTVTAIGGGAFYNCVSLETVMVPASVTHIQFMAFKGCTGLTSVQFAGTSQLTSIESEAFMGCKNLENFTIPASVNNIMSGTLDECPKLIDFEDGVGYVDQWAVTSDSDITQLILREDTVGIAWGAFANCENLFSVSFPESVKYINESAFGGCSSLTDVVIPAGVVTLQQAVFNQCYSLTSAWILTNDPSAFQPGVFVNSGLDYAYLVGTEEEWNDVVKSAFYTGNQYRDVTIYYNITFDVNGIAYISNGDGTCYVSGRGPGYPSKIDVLVIPSVSPAGDTVTAIGDNAFEFGLFSSLQLPDTLKLIGSNAFSWNNSLREVSIPASVTYIGVHAFGSCEILRVVDIPANSQLTCIDTQAFYWCYDLLDIIIPETVTSIGAWAFSSCYHLKAVIPKSVTYIGDYAFEYTAKVTFAPDSPLTEIGEGVFMGCNTRYFILPSNIKTIGDYAFQGCNSPGFFFPAGLTEIGYATFDGAIWFYYEGTEEAWNKITIGEKNEALLGTPDKFFLGDSFFTGASLTLGESLTMNYYATTESVFGLATVRFTYRGETFTVKGVRDKENGEYVFSLKGITPQCMGENIKAELILNVMGTEWILDVKESYSIREYCNDALAANPNNETLATLLADLLAYGDAAQDYANYNEDTPVSEGFEVAPSEWEDVTDTDFTLSDKTREKLCFAAAGVRFGYVNRVYFKIKAADLTGVTLTVNGKTYTADDLTLVENTADTYVLYTDAVYATEFDKVFTAKLALNGEELQTVTYSVRSYVYTKQNSNDTELAALVRALYNYGRSAIAYKNAQ